MNRYENKNDKDKMNNDDSFVIPYEAACSAEFSEGCYVMEDEEA